MALDINGDIWSWGSNDNGQLGLGDTLDRNFPCKVKLSNVSTLATCFHSLAIDNQGQLWSWDLLDLVLVMKLIHNLPQKVCINNAVSVSCGSHSAVIDKNGKTWVWGRNSDGQLGLGDLKSRFIPQELKLNVKNVSVFCGLFHTIILDENGDSWMCGDNKYGQLGIVDKTKRNTPFKSEFRINFIKKSTLPNQYT